MRVFRSIFRKKEDEKGPSPTDIGPSDLRPGWLFDLDGKTWEVKEEAIYDYDGETVREWRVESEDREMRFLNLEEDDGPVWSITQKVAISEVGEDLPSRIREEGDPPRGLEFRGMKFIMESSGGAYYFKGKGAKRTPVITWDYVAEDGHHVLTIEQWSDTDFEASFGRLVREYEFDNILPRG